MFIVFLVEFGQAIVGVADGAAEAAAVVCRLRCERKEDSAAPTRREEHAVTRPSAARPKLSQRHPTWCPHGTGVGESEPRPGRLQDDDRVLNGSRLTGIATTQQGELARKGRMTDGWRVLHVPTVAEFAAHVRAAGVRVARRLGSAAARGLRHPLHLRHRRLSRTRGSHVRSAAPNPPPPAPKRGSVCST